VKIEAIGADFVYRVRDRECDVDQPDDQQERLEDAQPAPISSGRLIGRDPRSGGRRILGQM
jgi:hypothetical protein